MSYVEENSSDKCDAHIAAWRRERNKHDNFLGKEEINYVRGYLKKRLYKSSDLDDAIQTTFLEAHRCREKFRGDSNKKYWICGIAMNVAKQFNRKSVLKKSETTLACIYSDEFTLDSVSSISSDSAEDVYAMHELTSQLEILLGNLSAEYRDVFSDVVLRGLSYKKAADKYSLPIGTVKSRISSARTYLKNATN